MTNVGLFFHTPFFPIFFAATKNRIGRGAFFYAATKNGIGRRPRGTAGTGTTPAAFYLGLCRLRGILSPPAPATTNRRRAVLDFSYDGPKRVRYAYDSNGNITCDPLRCFEIRYNLLNLSAEVIGHDPEESADSATASAGDGTTGYIGSLIYEGEPGQETFEGVSTDYGDITPHWLNCLFKNSSGVLFYCC